MAALFCTANGWHWHAELGNPIAVLTGDRRDTGSNYPEESGLYDAHFVMRPPRCRPQGQKKCTDEPETRQEKYGLFLWAK
jgi:hypothetical protein